MCDITDRADRKTLAQNDAVSITLFAFDKGEEISAHESTGDAFVAVLEGVGEYTVGGKKYEVHAGEYKWGGRKETFFVFTSIRYNTILFL